MDGKTRRENFRRKDGENHSVVDKHPDVAKVVDRCNLARKAVFTAEKEMQDYQKLLTKTIAGQLDAIERDLDQKNPLDKNRSPMSTAKIEDHIRTARTKMQIASEILEKRHQEYFEACEKAHLEMEDLLIAKYKEDIREMKRALKRITPHNDSILASYRDLKRYGVVVENYSWHELIPETQSRATKISAWNRSVKSFLAS